MNERFGLEGVVVAHTKLSEVDGMRGRLRIVGTPVQDLARAGSFERACALLWDEDEDAVRDALAVARRELWTPASFPSPGPGDGMVYLRSFLGGLDEDRSAPLLARNARTTAAVGLAAALYARQQRLHGAARLGGAPELPEGASHADVLLRLATGDDEHIADRARALGAYMATVCEHGMNASTFAARVVTSTESDLVSAVIAGIGALRGRLHGGAPGPVLDMLDAIRTPENASAYVRDLLSRGERIMGMGHRVYRVRDPRAAVLETALLALGDDAKDAGRLRMARHVEQTAERLLREKKPDRPLRANVEFYTACLLEALGVPREMFTAVFACSRVSGWCAHVAEHRRTGRLLRPKARYVGPRPS